MVQSDYEWSSIDSYLALGQLMSDLLDNPQSVLKAKIKNRLHVHLASL